MPFCRSCGKEIQGDAVFCPSCGTQVSSQQAPIAGSEFDRLTRDAGTQQHWLKRVIAYVIDWIIVSIITAIVFGIIAILAFGLALPGYLLNPASFVFPLVPGALAFTGLSALFFLAYFTLLEGVNHRTFGKGFLGLRVVTTDGTQMDILKAFVRNLSKIYWLLLLLDLIGGFFMNVKPGQKFTDHVANTNVVSA